MSWKSQQGYTLGFFLSKNTTAVATIASSVNTTIFTSAPLPVGVWLVTINDVGLTGALTQTLMTAYNGATAMASCGMLTDMNIFPSLVFVVASNGTAVITIDVDCDTSAGTWDIDVGKVQLAKLTDNL